VSRPRAVVSGGGGFVGRFVVERLLAEGYDVAVLGRTLPEIGFFSEPVDFLRADLEPQSAHPGLFKDASLFVHAAFDHLPGKYRGGEGGDPEGFRRRNLDGSAALFRAAKAAGVARLVFLSSRAVYGTQEPGLVLTETTPCRPDTLYGEVKLATEEALDALADSSFRPISLRVTGVYGPSGSGRPHKWSGLIADWRAGRAIPVRAGTEVHGYDVADAILRAARAGAGEPRLFNVSDILVDHADLVALLNEASGLSRPLPVRADISDLNVMATGRLEALGWRPGGRDLLRATIRSFCGTSGGE